ncbi:hypothetical protein C1646_750840 [Rhizophagus diaphanus]|nr:hypothetical protein C1646_750840 [Rhizophagus diaphanus] [Rhizophagus sp. MUCL 43196]
MLNLEIDNNSILPQEFGLKNVGRDIHENEDSKLESYAGEYDNDIKTELEQNNNDEGSTCKQSVLPLTSYVIIDNIQAEGKDVVTILGRLMDEVFKCLAMDCSLACKPKLLSSLHHLLILWNVIGHSKHHERNQEREQEQLTCDLKNGILVKIPNYLVTYQKEVTILEEDMRIFEMNLTTQEALDGFQTILKKFEYGCQGPSPHIIILEPGDNPNSDQTILEAANMYKADFNLPEIAYLDIIADKAIFYRLVRCQAQWPQLRPLLRQWHILKNFCSVLIVLFSSYGLLNLARKLGVQFLDKFEAAVDYLITSRVLDFCKSNYAVAIAQHLFTLIKYPKLNKILQHVRLFRMSTNIDDKNNNQKSVCFRFDEALEMNTSIFQSECAIDSRRKILWELIEDLVMIFDMTDPLSHQIFKDLEPPEIHKEEYKKLLAYYENGLK